MGGSWRPERKIAAYNYVKQSCNNIMYVFVDVHSMFGITVVG
jgi:hypothetical protein